MTVLKNILLFSLFTLCCQHNLSYAEEGVVVSSKDSFHFSEPIPPFLTDAIDRLVSGESVAQAEKDCDQFIKTACNYVQKLIQYASHPSDYDDIETFLQQACQRLITGRHTKGYPELTEYKELLEKKVTNLHAVVAAWQSWQAFRHLFGDAKATERFILPLTQVQRFSQSSSSYSNPRGINWMIPLPRSIALKPLMDSPGPSLPETNVQNSNSQTVKIADDFSLESQNNSLDPIKKAIFDQDYTTLLAHYYSRMKENWFHNFSIVDPVFLWAIALRMDEGGQYDFAAELYILVLMSERRLDPVVAVAAQKRLDQIKTEHPERFQQGRLWAMQVLKAPGKHHY